MAAAFKEVVTKFGDGRRIVGVAVTGIGTDGIFVEDKKVAGFMRSSAGFFKGRSRTFSNSGSAPYVAVHAVCFGWRSGT